MKPELEEHYPLRKAAEILGVHPVTLRRWEKEGKIRYIRTPSGQRRFPRSEVLRLVGETMPSGRRLLFTPAFLQPNRPDREIWNAKGSGSKSIAVPEVMR
jgi:putative resolvase